mgnify:CR=1 FL=1
MSAAEAASIPTMPVHKTGISMGAKNEAPSGTKSDTSTKNEKKIKCGYFSINGVKKEFYSDLYFLILHNNEKEKNIIFEELIEKILGVIKIKELNL